MHKSPVGGGKVKRKRDLFDAERWAEAEGRRGAGAGVRGGGHFGSSWLKDA